jgi:hypothetical protein
MRDWLFAYLSMAALEAILLSAGVLTIIFVAHSLREDLKSISHPVARRFGWRRTLFFLLVPLVPFWNNTLGFLLVPGVLALAAFQVERLWLLRASGSETYLAFLRQAASQSTRSAAILCNLSAGVLVAASAGALWLVSPNPEQDWGYWYALGLGMYALINGYERSRAAARIFDSLPPDGAA